VGDVPSGPRPLSPRSAPAPTSMRCAKPAVTAGSYGARRALREGFEERGGVPFSAAVGAAATVSSSAPGLGPGAGSGRPDGHEAGGQKRKRPETLRLQAHSEENPGDVLLSHTASRAVPSAPKSLTSEFGMGSGVASSKSSPETCGSFIDAARAADCSLARAGLVTRILCVNSMFALEIWQSRTTY
jgi:hypothetical protein